MAADKYRFIGINNVFLVSTFACVIIVPTTTPLRANTAGFNPVHTHTMCIIEFDIKIIILGKIFSQSKIVHQRV